jgi:hypothetical protein
MAEPSGGRDPQPARVLVLGLDPHRVPGPWDPTPVADGIAAGKAKFEARGVAAAYCLVGLDGSDDVPAVITQALGAHPWECVVIGGGIRHDDALFEQVVNLVRRHAPGAAIAFNDSPADCLEAAERWIDLSQ